ncbi:hypothetical protein LWI29_002260 [Acer saccharum]|uniref:Pentatricopeptide repeat-containing protein n=1 Tax=Acer saccharum TaxID=4024 RepID=A0AA39VRH5_ACESA|nr:hypothetical protein LWI29_002260 [Acer saccharum]
MRRAGIVPLNCILISTLSSCASLVWIMLGQQVHSEAFKLGLDFDVPVSNALLAMYAKSGPVDDSRLVFRFMVDKNYVTWNTIISGLDQIEYFEEAIKSFCKMRRAGVVPSNFTLISTLNSCASLGLIMLGQQVHGEAFKLGLDSDVSVSNALLALYADTGCLAECLKFFSLTPEDDQVSWNTVIGSLSVSESSISEAVKYYLNMMRVGVSPNRVIFINILAAVSSSSLGKVSQQIHAQVIKYHIADDTAIENALLACYGKCGQMDECEKIFSRLSDRKDDVSWNLMISGYRHNNLWHKAMVLERGMELHASALRACLESNVLVGGALVAMYSKCGRIDYALRFFDMMPKRTVYSWNSMISGYARHGYGDKALRLFSRMIESGQRLDHFTVTTVLSACASVATLEHGMEVHASALRACLESDVVVGTWECTC